MPYISKEQRDKYHALITVLNATPEIETKGDLEYLIFSLMKKFMVTRDNKYTTLHDCVYATQHCSDEFRRRFLDKREDNARQQNGDIEC